MTTDWGKRFTHIPSALDEIVRQSSEGVTCHTADIIRWPKGKDTQNKGRENTGFCDLMRAGVFLQKQLLLQRSKQYESKEFCELNTSTV